VLVNPSADDPETKARTKAFLQGMQELGWIDGRNMRVDIRWEVGFENQFRRVAGYVDPQGRKAG
jgi:putative ABC transport system substrate-binding protein